MHPRTTTTVSHAPRRDVAAPPEPAGAAVAAAPFDKALERPSAGSAVLGLPSAVESQSTKADVVRPGGASDDVGDVLAKPDAHEDLAVANDSKPATVDEQADRPATDEESHLSAETIIALFAIAPPPVMSPPPSESEDESTAWVVVKQTAQTPPGINGAAAPLVAIATAAALDDSEAEKSAERPGEEPGDIALPADLIAESDRPSEPDGMATANDTHQPANAPTAEREASDAVDPPEPPANVDALLSETQAPAVAESDLSSPQAVQALVVDPAIGAQQRPRNGSDALGERPIAGDLPQPMAIHTQRLLNRVARAFNAARERDGEIRLRLSPVELGSLRLEIQMQEGSLIGRVEAETSAAQMAILDSLPVLRERLAELGMRIERFDVDLMQRDAGHSSEGSPEQERSQPQLAVVPATPRLRTDPPAAVGTKPVTPAASGRLNVIV